MAAEKCTVCIGCSKACRAQWLQPSRSELVERDKSPLQCSLVQKKYFSDATTLSGQRGGSMVAEAHRVRSPGRARCQLDYDRKEQVVQVQVLEKVKAARREVQEQYCADVMGVRGPQWTCSSFVPDSKYTTAASDTHLQNHLLPSALCQSDLRHTRPPAQQRYDTQHYHAFTRGEVTTGWNHSTELPSRHQHAQLQQLDNAALAATAQHRVHLKQYQPPPQREVAFAAALRQKKQEATAQAAALVKQYGPEGAAVMQQILAMKPPNRKPIHIKATKDDIAAVQQLPAAGLADP